MGELIPFHDQLAVQARMRGDEHVHYDNRTLSRAEQALVDAHVDITLFFGVHATDPEDYTGVEESFDQFDPERTVILIEGVGYSHRNDMHDQHFTESAPMSERMRRQREAILRSRSAQGQNYWGAHNSFKYAREFCLANGYTVLTADVDTHGHRAWSTMHEHSEAAHGPDGQKLFKRMLDGGFLELPFVEAMIELYRARADNNALVGAYAAPEIIYRWGEYHRVREEAAVSRIQQVALSLAHDREGRNENTPRRQVALFFGAGHQRGIEARLRERGLHYKSTNMTGVRYQDAAADMPFDEHNLRTVARDFMMEFAFQNLSFESKEAYDDKREAIKGYFEFLTIDDLQEIYEIFRGTMRELTANIDVLTDLQRDILQRRIETFAPETMRGLTAGRFEARGIDEQKVREVYQRRQDVKRQFRAETVAVGGLVLHRTER